ncbi:UNVERIFIED_CONTAM: hypothetical protein FKN15_074157 [Acipenser sinensis]
MDERRQQNMAYEYLCHLEEAKRWMEACLDEELPPTTELEEGLRNGKIYDREQTRYKKIYDREQTRYKATGLHFRHTDNVIQWLNAMNEIGLPKIFYPETTDIYDRKNMPRSIYCIHALSLYLFKLGLAPQIQDLYGKVDFTEEEINNMKSELEKYGIQMPAFSKIGGILANELSVDEAALHAAVIAINDAIDHGEPGGTMAAMRNPNAMLVNLDEGSSQRYQHTLQQAKQDKVANARKRITGENSQEERDVYEELLTQAEIQGNVNKVNLLNSLETVDRALRGGDEAALYDALRSQALGLRRLQPDNKDWYLKQLSSDREAKEQGSLTHPELLVAVEMLSSVALINRALDTGDRQAVWKQLESSVTGLSNVEDENAQRYIDDLTRLKAAARAEGNPFLTWNDIQACVDQVNGTVQEEHERIIAIGLINEALDHGNAQTTLAALQHPAAKLSEVRPPVAQHYHDTLVRARREKAQDTQDDSAVLWLDEIQDGVCSSNKETEDSQQCDNGSDWVKHWVKGGYDYYFNIRTREGSWEEPANFIENNTQLGREDIQATISGVTSAYNREQLWLANENLITELQARCRGYLVRNGQTERLNYLKRQGPAITSIQIQSKVRMHQARKRYQDRLKYFRDHIDDIVKIQAFIRANKARDDYKTLINAADPPMAVVRKFVHLLDQSDQDFQEELELMRLREEVVTQIRSNQQLENDLNLMDIKIGLLVKNKITLQEVVSHSKKLTKKNKGQLSDMMMMNKQGGLKALSKAKREKLEAYQFLFYLLQTNPTYLAKLIFQMPQNKSTKFMDSVIFTLYNYASNQREEYLLLKLFKTALQEEIKSKVDQIQEIVTGNPTVIKMVVSFNRGARGQNALRQILAPVVKETMDDKALSIKTDPLPYDVTPEQALSHEEVRTRLDASIKHMRTVTDKFLSAITVSVDKIPYGMRFIAKVLKDTLHEKFPDATEDELLKIIGNLLYYRYMNPAIVAPDAFDIIDMSAGGQLTTDQRRNLGSIAKMLQHAASNKMFIGDNSHLANINEYLSNSYQKFRRFLLAACDVPPLEDKFNVDEYSDLVTLTKPVIYITIAEIINTHTLLLNHQDAIASDHNDPIHELLEDLGEVPTIESMVGEGTLSPGDPNWDMLTKTEVSLTLTNKFDVPGSENEEMDARTLMLNSKRLIVDVIRFQPGETLTEILETPASSEQDIRNQRRYRQRRKAELVKLQQTNGALNSKSSFYAVQIDYYNQYIKTCMDNLASKGKVSKKPGQVKKSKQVSQKYTAARLHEKGDLLQLQYEGVAVMKLFDRATVNVNLLIFLLNKKFYGK